MPQSEYPFCNPDPARVFLPAELVVGLRTEPSQTDDLGVAELWSGRRPDPICTHSEEHDGRARDAPPLLFAVAIGFMQTMSLANCAARRSYRWCKPTRYGIATISPSEGVATDREIGASLLSAR
jgi:hypothetical protein